MFVLAADTAPRVRRTPALTPNPRRCTWSATSTVAPFDQLDVMSHHFDSAGFVVKLQMLRGAKHLLSGPPRSPTRHQHAAASRAPRPIRIKDAQP